MSLLLPAPETLYAALLARDPAFDDHAFVGVTTTGIFCRFTCPARKPLFAHTEFFDSAAACLQAGFRPCLRCRPLESLGRRQPLIADLLHRFEQDPSHAWSESDLAAIGYTPSTVRRAFQQHLGISFLEFARLRRVGSGMAELSTGTSVIDAQLEAGFDSSAGFREAIARLVREPPSELRGRTLLRADWIETPIGPMLAIADTTSLHLLEFADRKALPTELRNLRAATRSAIAFARSPVLDCVAAELALYFAGRSAVFSLPLALHGSPFSRAVWHHLRSIPAGTTQSYRDLAHTAAEPTATRAVARANGANQLAIVIPCHRVLGHDGSLTGYAGGLWRKRWLLTHEQKHFAPATKQDGIRQAVAGRGAIAPAPPLS